MLCIWAGYCDHSSQSSRCNLLHWLVCVFVAVFILCIFYSFIQKKRQFSNFFSSLVTSNKMFHLQCLKITCVFFLSLKHKYSVYLIDNLCSFISLKTQSNCKKCLLVVCSVFMITVIWLFRKYVVFAQVCIITPP